MATEIGPLPKGHLQWRENSAEIPNKIMITMKHLTSSYKDKNKLQNKILKCNYQVFLNTPLTQYYLKHAGEITSIPKILKQEKKST